MSGKKSGQVVDLLEKGLRARDMTNNTINLSLRRNYDSVVKDENEIDKIKHELSEVPVLSLDAEEMFSSKGKQQGIECRELHEQILNLKSNTQELLKINDHLKEIDKEIQICDREASAIRRAVANKYDYCDAEYRRAGKLKKRYENAAAGRKELDYKAQSLATESASILQEALEKKASFVQLCKSIENMNQAAMNRKAANSLKTQVEETLQSISAEWADKFFKNEFEKINNGWNKIKHKEDVLLIQEAPAILNEVNAFVSKLTRRVAQWEKEKNDAKNELEQVESVMKIEFVDPIDYNSNGDNAEKFKLFEYLNKFDANELNDKITSLIKEAEIAMENESFVDAKNIYMQAEKLTMEARDHALSLQERMFKKMELAKAIEQVMYEMDYETETLVIDDNPNNGFRIICTAGDEVIDFTNVNYDNDGNPILEIDHKEPAGGNCHKSWTGITKAMRQYGIPLTDVRKNGESILNRSVGKNTDSKGIHEVEQSH